MGVRGYGTERGRNREMREEDREEDREGETAIGNEEREMATEKDGDGCVSEKGDHMGWPDSATNYKFVVHTREEIPIIS